MSAGDPFVAGVILAAGRSERFGGGRPKLVLELGGEALVRRVARAALGSRLRQVIVVLGHAASEVGAALAGLDVIRIENADYARGQSTSVRAGLARVDAAARAAMFLPADQPLLSSRLIDRLIVAYCETERPIVRPIAGNWRGAPILWDQSLFDALAALEGDEGGRQLLPRHADSVLEVEIEDPLELADVDTAGGLRRLERALRVHAFSLNPRPDLL